MNLWNKKEKENELEDPQVVNPESGNVPEVKTSEKLIDMKKTIQESDEQAKELGKFFVLEIGEKARVTIDFDRSETFKVKTKAGDLVNQFRYYLLDHRYNREKQFDTWVNQAKAIVHNVENDHPEMTIKCMKNQMGGKKYVVVPYEDEV